MSKVSITDCNSGKEKTIVSAKEILVGTYFTGRLAGRNSLFVKSYDSIINLNDPSETWRSDNDKIEVVFFKEVDVNIAYTGNT